VEAVGATLLIADIAFYFAMSRPLRSQIASEQQRYTQLRQGVRDQQFRVDRLEKFKAEMPSAGQWLTDFADAHTPSDRRGLSAAAHLIRQAASDSGVRVSTVGFHPDMKHNDPFEPLGLEVQSQGSYPDLIKFAHNLETANNLILIRQFSLVADDKGAIGLRLMGDFYLTP
jgi:Tfp pilus assembly protein PilO